jgi:hypothetical protein
VVQDPDTDQLERIAKFLRDGTVGGARFRDPARMIVGQDGRAGVAVQCCTDYLARMDAGPINCAVEEPLAAQDTVATVEPHDVEFFVWQSAQSHPEEVLTVPRVSNAPQPFELAMQDVFGGLEDVIFRLRSVDRVVP